jgi:ascorbate-specific PTS system EIIC-type component UlaA
MQSRMAAVILGLIAGIAAFFTLTFSWTEALAFLRLDHAALLVGVGGAARAAWTISGGIVAFATVVLLVALITGMAETAKVRTRIDELRLDPALAGKWNAADWRVAFASTAIADQAEAMIAIIPVETNEERRVVVDAPLLLGLNRIWLDRLTLAWTVGPLPLIVLGLAATLGLFAYASGGKWDAAIAAGTAGWFEIALVQYMVRAVLSPLIDGAVAAATAAIRPLSSVHALEAYRQIVRVPETVPPKRIEQEEAEIIAAALSNVIWEPLTRLADASEKLTSAATPPSRVQEIEVAMAEIRAGIESLLNNPGA